MNEGFPLLKPEWTSSGPLGDTMRSLLFEMKVPNSNWPSAFLSVRFPGEGRRHSVVYREIKSLFLFRVQA